MILCFYICKWQ